MDNLGLSEFGPGPRTTDLRHQPKVKVIRHLSQNHRAAQGVANFVQGFDVWGLPTHAG